MMLDVVVGRVGRRLWSVIGLSSSLAVGCGPETIDVGDDDTGGMTSAPGPMTEGSISESGGPGSASGSASASGSSASSGSASGTETASGSDTGWQNDCGDNVMVTVCVDPDGGSSDGGPPEPTSSSSGGDGTGAADDTGGTEASGDTEGLCEGINITDPTFCVYGTGEVFVQDGQCCAVLSGTEHCCDGRPFLVDGHARAATLQDRGDWAAELVPAVADLTEAERDALATAWCDDGLMEHASVASFARFALQMVAVGAPPELLVDTQRAIRDEIEHARLCFGLASAYAGRPIGPGPLAVDGALEGQIDLAAAAVATVREGCIGETIAAVHAELAAHKANDATVRAVLLQIAEDEARHAALAWRFVAWAVAEGGAAVRRAVTDAFAGGPAPQAVADPPIDAARWHAHGRLTDAEHAELVHRCCRELVAPLARGLLASRRPAAAPAPMPKKV